MKLWIYNVGSLTTEQLKDGLLYLVAQHLAEEIDQERFVTTYNDLVFRMDSEGIETIQWVL